MLALVFDFDQTLAGSLQDLRENDLEASLRITREFFHDRLKVTFVALLQDILEGGGAAERLEAEYEWTRHVSLSAGLVAYQSGTKSWLSKLGENDLVFLKVKFSF